MKNSIFFLHKYTGKKLFVYFLKLYGRVITKTPISHRKSLLLCIPVPTGFCGTGGYNMIKKTKDG